MKYNFNQALQILTRTPMTLQSLLIGLDDDWTQQNEGPDTWSPFDVVAHLIHGEKTDWVTRIKLILAQEGEAFEPFDMFAHFEESKGKSMEDLLQEFEGLRLNNILELQSLNISEDQYDLKGIHPAFGEVSLQELLSTWVAHDLNHISQIVRTMASQYKDEVGPWKEYLGILKHA